MFVDSLGVKLQLCASEVNAGLASRKAAVGPSFLSIGAAVLAVPERKYTCHSPSRFASALRWLPEVPCVELCRIGGFTAHLIVKKEE